MKPVSWVIIGVTSLFLLCLSSCGLYRGSAVEVEFTIKKTERVTQGAGNTLSSKYLIFTESEVFEITDSLCYWRFDSSDLYGKMEGGKRFKATVAGWRIPFLSWYRNVIRAEEVH